MANRIPNVPREPTLSLRIGRWFEASATGWGVLALAAIVLLILGAAAWGVRL